MKKNILLSFFLLSVISYQLSNVLFAQDETLTLLTYYPAPYGIYQNLIVTRTEGITELEMSNYSTTNKTQNYPRLKFTGIRGTQQSPLETRGGDKFGEIQFWGYGEDHQYHMAAQIYATPHETGEWTGTISETDLRFAVTSSGFNLRNIMEVRSWGLLINPNDSNICTLNFNGSNASEIVGREATGSNNGSNLTIRAGRPNYNQINKNGGNLILSSGISTGTGGSDIEFKTATPWTSGTTDNTPNTKMKIFASGALSRGGTISGTNDEQRSQVNFGADSTTSKAYATILGGSDNTANQTYATIVGGLHNTASGPGSLSDASFVGGGNGNNASGQYSFIGGGSLNTTSGTCSTIPGGTLNTAAGMYSFAAGRRAKANHNGCFVWADNTDADYSSTDINQFRIRANGGIFLSGLRSGSGSWVDYNTTTKELLYETSSIRYKENINPFIDDFHKILELSPKSFTFKETGQKSFGYIAEELDKLGLKNLVSYDENGQPDAALYKLIPVYLLEIIKDQQDSLNKLKTKTIEFEARIKTLEVKLKKIK